MKSSIIASEFSETIVGKSKLIHTLKAEEYLVRNNNKIVKNTWKPNPKTIPIEHPKLFEEFLIIGESQSILETLELKKDYIPSQVLYQYPGLSSNW